MKKGNFEKAEKYIYFSMPELWNWTRTHNIFGIIAMERERFREARMAFETALETGGKGEVKTLVNLGVLSVNEGKTEDARSWFNTALSREPHSPEALYNSGLLEIKEKNYRRAEKYLAKCIAIQPSHKQALNNMGILKIYTNKPGEAEKYFRKALKLRPGDPQLMVNIAVTALMRDKFFKARVWLNKALASCPGYPPATVLKEKLDKVEEKSIK
jgi:Flp pilus assembly protein TadD